MSEQSNDIDAAELLRVLELPATTEPAAIREAYRRKEEAWRPERFPNDLTARARHARLTEAFRVWTATQPPPDLDAMIHDIGDLFGEFFGAKQVDRSRGADLSMPLEVDQATASVGGRRAVKVKRRVRCERCLGSGARDEGSLRPCDRCDGKGQQVSKQGALSIARPCAVCLGLGTLVTAECSARCDHGFVTRPEVLSVSIPPNMADGMMLRLQGKGSQGRGGSFGDLFLTITIVEPAFSGEDMPVPLGVAFFGGTLRNASGTVRVPAWVRDGTIVPIDVVRANDGPYRDAESSAPLVRLRVSDAVAVARGLSFAAPVTAAIIAWLLA